MCHVTGGSLWRFSAVPIGRENVGHRLEDGRHQRLLIHHRDGFDLVHQFRLRQASHFDSRAGWICLTEDRGPCVGIFEEFIDRGDVGCRFDKILERRASRLQRNA